ncbi:hypothetical protein H0X09_01075 [Candidatus Saccharibacteria bacterium]|nr:hypothetical protein [Candidatus Saccharibacteria bacterium]
MSTLAPNDKIHNPEINLGVFNGQLENYWVGRIATANMKDRGRIFEAAAIFRGDVYLNLGYVSPEQVDELGREIDSDDSRSIHFSVMERIPGSDPNNSRIIGTSRLILKDSPHNQLPIEYYFPEVFQRSPAPVGTVEVSRLIAHHEDGRIQYRTALSLIRAMTHFSINRGIKADYCMVEEPLLRFLNSQAIPTEIMGESKEITEQGGVLFPVKIEPSKIIKNVSSSSLGKTALKNFFLNGRKNGGEGYYDGNFIKE